MCGTKCNTFEIVTVRYIGNNQMLQEDAKYLQRNRLSFLIDLYNNNPSINCYGNKEQETQGECWMLCIGPSRTQSKNVDTS